MLVALRHHVHFHRKTYFRKYNRHPLAPTLPRLGAGVHMMDPNYLYRNSLLICAQVIPHYRNRGASAAGRSPWSVKSI